MGWRYYGAIEERIIGMDRSASDAVRITLDQVRLDRVPPSRIPQKVCISLHEKAVQWIQPSLGMRVMTTGHFSPPSGPVEPGGFDFQRHAWFGQLCAVGYTRVPLIGLTVAAEDWKLWVFQTVMTISARTGSYKMGHWWFCGSCYNWGSLWNEPSGIGGFKSQQYGPPFGDFRFAHVITEWFCVRISSFF